VAAKLIIASGANDTVTPEQLLDHWHRHHAGLVIEHLRPQRYAITTVRPKRGYHGVATLHLDGTDASFDPLPPAIAADPFYGMLAVRTPLRVTEHVIVDAAAPDGSFRVIALVRRRPEVDVDRFRTHWLEVHAPNVAEHLRRTDGAWRYVVNLATDQADDAPFHGVAELWYRDEAASRAHLGAVPDDGFEALTADIVFLEGDEAVLTG